MRALSLTQPWATLLATKAKRFETRGWATNLREIVAIHAAKAFPDDCRELCLTPVFSKALRAGGVEKLGDVPRGAIIGTGRIVACYSTTGLSVAEALAGVGFDRSLAEQERAFGNYAPGRYAFVFSDVIALAQPIPCKGALGLWTVPPEIEAQIRSAA